MKFFLVSFVFLIPLFVTLSSEARDDRNMWSINEAMNASDAKQRLGNSVRFYFGNHGHPAVATNFGDFLSNKKTNAFNKTDKKACQWNFLSAMLTFKARAQKMGGNAVINIRSYYKKNEISSETQFECGSGTFVSGVTFLGDVVKLQE